MSSETSQFPNPEPKRASSLLDLESRQRHTLSGETISIGRSEDNKLCLKDDVYVSGHHAEIYFEGGQFWLRDLNSRNGTMKNKDSVTEPAKLEPGDVIKIGKARFEVE